jgi:hypothetical protein
MKGSISVLAVSAVLLVSSSVARAQAVDPLSDAYERTGVALDALGEASFSMASGDREAAVLQIDYAAGAAAEALSALAETDEDGKRPARSIRNLGRRFFSRILAAQAAGLDGRISDETVSRKITVALRAGTTIRGRVSLAADGILLSAPTVDVTGIWVGTYDPTGANAQAYSWWVVFRQTKGSLTATLVALTSTGLPYENASANTIEMTGWVSGNTVYLYASSGAKVLFRATISGTSLSGSYYQGYTLLFSPADGSGNFGNLTGNKL